MSATPSAPVRWGFVGAGYVASRAMAPAVHASPHATLYAAAARDVQRATALEPTGTATHDYRRLLDDESVEAVYVALTNDAHLPWVVAALEAGKHVLCEKPLALNAEQVRSAYAVARAAHRQLVEAAWNQWHPRTRRVDELVRGGDVGRVDSIVARFTFDGVPPGNYRLDPARGGGALLDVGPYVLRPLAVWVAEPWQVESVTRQVSPGGVDLRTTARLHSVAGATAEIDASFRDPEHQQLAMVGENLALTWSPPAFTSWREASSLDLTDGSRRWHEWFPPCDAYELMVSSVSRRIRGDSQVHVVGEAEVVRSAELLDAVAGAESA